MNEGDLLPDPGKGTAEKALDALNRLVAASIGAGAGLFASPFAGPPASVAASSIGDKVIDRLVRRQQTRAEMSLSQAAKRIQERDAEGETPNSDFEGEDELNLLETSIRAAISSTNEKKARLIGNFYASCIFEADLGPDDALAYLGDLDQMTWRQICALAYFADDGRTSDRELYAAGGTEGVRQIVPGCEQELSRLARTRELIGFVQEDGSVSNPSNAWGPGLIVASEIHRVALTGRGKTLYRLAEIGNEVDQEDIDTFVVRNLG